MRKILSFILTLVACLGLGGLVYSNTVSAVVVSPYNYEFTQQVDVKNDEPTDLGGVLWTKTKHTGNCGFENTRKQQFQNVIDLALTTSDIKGTITKVVISTCSNTKQLEKSDIFVIVGGQEFGVHQKLTKNSTLHEFVGEGIGELSLNFHIEDKKSLYIQSISVEFITGTVEKVLLTYNDNHDGVAARTVEVIKGTQIKLLDPETTYEGYKFIGWSIGKPDSTNVVSSIIVNEATTVYANWEKIEYVKVTLDYGNRVEIKDVEKNSKFVEVAHRPGMIFEGWYNGDQKLDDTNNTITTEVILKANWTSGSLNTCKEVNDAAAEQKMTILVKVVGNPKSLNYTVSDGISETNLYDPNNTHEYKLGSYYQVTGITGEYKGTKQIKQEGYRHEFTMAEIFAEESTKSSLKITYDLDTKEPTDVDLRFGGMIDALAYDSTAEYGVIVVPTTEDLTNVTPEKLAELNAKNMVMTCTPARVDEKGVASETGSYYQFAWVITNMEGHYDFAFNAVMYMVKDGKVYLSQVNKNDSVQTVAKRYVDNAVALGLTEEQVQVLNKLLPQA